MAVPTIEQICCIVGADTPCRHSYAGVLPTVNCRSSGTCQWYSPPKTMARPTLSKRISGAHSLLHPQRNVLDGTQNRLCRACGATLVCHRLGRAQKIPATSKVIGICMFFPTIYAPANKNVEFYLLQLKLLLPRGKYSLLFIHFIWEEHDFSSTP